MSTITVRDLDQGVKDALRRRAAAHGRSMEAEVRAILAEAVSARDLGNAWLDAVSALRGDDLPLPDRHAPRQPDIS